MDPHTSICIPRSQKWKFRAVAARRGVFSRLIHRRLVYCMADRRICGLWLNTSLFVALLSLVFNTLCCEICVRAIALHSQCIHVFTCFFKHFTVDNKRKYFRTVHFCTIILNPWPTTLLNYISLKIPLANIPTPSWNRRKRLSDQRSFHGLRVGVHFGYVVRIDCPDRKPRRMECVTSD